MNVVKRGEFESKGIQDNYQEKMFLTSIVHLPGLPWNECPTRQVRPPPSTSANAPPTPPTSESAVELLVGARQAPPPEWVHVDDVTPLLNRPPTGAVSGSSCGGGDSVTTPYAGSKRDGEANKGGGGGGEVDFAQRASAFAISEALRRDWQVGDIGEMDLGNGRWGAVQITGSHTQVSVKWVQEDGDDDGENGSRNRSNNHNGRALHHQDNEQGSQPAQGLQEGLGEAQGQDEHPEWIPATSIVPRSLLGDHDFLPFDFVQRTDAMCLTDQEDNSDAAGENGVSLCMHLCIYLFFFSQFD